MSPTPQAGGDSDPTRIFQWRIFRVALGAFSVIFDRTFVLGAGEARVGRLVEAIGSRQGLSDRNRALEVGRSDF